MENTTQKLAFHRWVELLNRILFRLQLAAVVLSALYIVGEINHWSVLTYAIDAAPPWLTLYGTLSCLGVTGMIIATLALLQSQALSTKKLSKQHIVLSLLMYSFIAGLFKYGEIAIH